MGAVVAQSAGEHWVQYVLVIPGLGWLLERIFLPPRYFRKDTELMFMESVARAFREALTAVDSQLKAPFGRRWLT